MAASPSVYLVDETLVYVLSLGFSLLLSTAFHVLLLSRQAAISVVRSLSKGHKPAGSGVCSKETEPFTHLVIPDEKRRTLKVTEFPDFSIPHQL